MYLWVAVRLFKVATQHKGPVLQRLNCLFAVSPINAPVMSQSHPTMGPRTILAPVRFLAHKAEWSTRRNFTPVLFSWSNQALDPARFDTAVHLWFDRIIRRTPQLPRAMPVLAYSACPTRESLMFFISYVTRAGPVQDPQECHTAPLRTGKAIDTTRIYKNPARGPYGPLKAPYGLLTDCLRGGKIPLTGPVSGLTYAFSSKQSVNIPGTARTGPGSMTWLGHYITFPGPVWGAPGLFRTEIVRPLTGPVRALCGGVRILPPHTRPVEV